jgi:hypothetical protein
MIDVISNHLVQMEEADTAELLKYIYPDLVKKNPNNEYEGTDYYSERRNIDIEFKNRKNCKKTNLPYHTYLIEKPKYDKLMAYENGYYICTGANGIYCWDVKKYTQEIGVNWQWEKHSKNTLFGDRDEYVDKLCDYWNIGFADNLTFLLLYPELISEKINRFPLSFMKY